MTLLSELGLPPIEPSPEQSFTYHQPLETGVISMLMGSTSHLLVDVTPSATYTRRKHLELDGLRVDWSQRSAYNGPFSLHAEGEWDETVDVATSDEMRQGVLRLRRNLSGRNILDVSERELRMTSALNMATEANLNLAVVCDESDVVRALFSSAWSGWSVIKTLNGAAPEGQKRTFFDQYDPTEEKRTMLVDTADLILTALQALRNA